jgi:hypothetical protein
MTKIAQSTPITFDARLKPYDESGIHQTAQCGNCGQALWMITFCGGGDSELPTWFLANQTQGWRFTCMTRTWWPTDQHLAMRYDIRTRIRKGTATADERHQLATTRHFFARRGVKPDADWTYGPERTEMLRLPITIVCPECRAECRVNAPLATSEV